ncbi:MAG: hypothetical protein U0531_03835 [Dehalococcoidia bacterium]
MALATTHDPDLPVIVLAGDLDAAAVVALRRAGARACLSWREAGRLPAVLGAALTAAVARREQHQATVHLDRLDDFLTAINAAATWTRWRPPPSIRRGRSSTATARPSAP